MGCFKSCLIILTLTLIESIESMAGQNDAKVMGGSPVQLGKYPFMAELVYEEEPKKFVHLCGGSLITVRLVLTVAHCIKYINIRKMKVVVGLIETYEHLEKWDYELHAISNYRFHEKYIRVMLQNDIGILVLQKPVKRSRSVDTICLSSTLEVYPGQSLISAGWGVLHPDSTTHQSLRRATGKVKTIDMCVKKFGPLNESLTICTHDTNEATCNGDSGGPTFLMYRVPNFFLQVGVTSGGHRCAYNPSVKTKIKAYSAWLNRTANALDEINIVCFL